jgi:fluoroquinolone resistance protein
MSDDYKLKQRWLPERLQEVNAQLASGDMIKSPFPMVTGDNVARHDLRGIIITEMVSNVTLDGIDLSFSAFSGAGQFVNASCVECAFVGASLETNLGVSFVRCDFTRAKLNVIRGVFKECIFRNADLVSSLGRDIRFLRCDFSGANLRKANLYQCTFDQCRWENSKFGSGSLAESQFFGEFPSNSALGNTMLEGTKFLPKF